MARDIGINRVWDFVVLQTLPPCGNRLNDSQIWISSRLKLTCSQRKPIASLGLHPEFNKKMMKSRY